MNSDDKKSILLVEDEVIIAMLETQQLEEKGYSVHHVTTGEDAVKVILDNALPVNLILMDIDLGSGIDGTQTAEKILKEKDIPIVFLSSHTEPEVVEKTENITSYGYVVKNSGLVVLDASIKMAMKLFNANIMQKMTEEKLKERNTYIEAILANMPIGFGVNSIDDGDVKYINNKFEEIYGWSKDVLSNVSIFFEKVFPDPGYRDLMKEKIISDMQSGDPKRMNWDDIKIVTSFNEERYVNAINISLPDQNLMISTVQDNTKRKLAEKALEESEKKLTSILNNMTDVVWSISWPDLTHNYLSPSVEKVYGRSEQEFLDNPILFKEVTHPDDRHLTEKAMKQLAEEGKAERECRIIKPDGCIVWINDRSKMIYDENHQPIRVEGLTRDITERVQMEDELRASEERWRLLVTSIPDFISILDTDDRFLFLNHYAEGFSEIDVIGTSVYAFMPDESINLFREKINDCKTTLKLQKFEHSAMGDHGILRQYDDYAIPIQEKNGSVLTMIVSRDITDRKQAEIELKESKLFHEKLLETVPVPIFYKDTQGRYIGFNKHFENFFGKSREELIGKSVFDISPEELAQIYHAKDKELFDEVGTQIYDSQVKTAKGEIKDVVFHKASLVNDEGEITALIGAILDITERKQAEEILRESESRLVQAQRIANMGDFVWEVETGNITWSEGMHSLLGYDKSEKIDYSKVNTEIHHPDDLERVTNWLKECLDSGKSYHSPNEYRLIRKNGKVLTVQTSVSIRYKDDKPVEMIGTCMDITKRKQAEDEINKFKTITEQSVHGNAIADLKGKLLYINKAFAEVHGYEPDELLGKNISVFHTKAQMSNVDQLNKELEMNGYYGHEEVWHVHRDGTEFPMLMSGVLVTDEQETPQFLAASAIDITERKKAEEEIQKQLSDKEILLREVHHRVKNNISNIASLLSLQAGSTNNLEVSAALNDAVSRVQSMRILYDKLLLSKDIHKISIKTYIEDLVDSLHDIFVDKDNIIIEKHISDFNIISKQATPIGIIINELLTNVFKYAFKDRDKGTVSVSIEKTENMVTIIIQDNGIGIDGRILENKSPGFGLTIVKMLVEQLKGTYSMVNDNGTKSVIKFEI